MIYSCQWALPGKDLIMCVHGIRQHSPSFWIAHDVTIITSFAIPCNLWPVLASFVFAGICFILHLNWIFFFDPSNSLTDTFVENSSGSSLNIRSFNSVDNLFFKFWRSDWTCCIPVLFVFGSEPRVLINWSICASNCTMVLDLLMCSHYTHLTSFVFIVHTFLPW